MADTQQPQAPAVIISGEQHAREQLAREMAEMSKNPLDTTVPGGRYASPDGSLHDAEGRPLSGGKASAAKQPAAGGEETDYESMTVEELADEAGDLEVEGTGAGGRVLKADYVKALQKRDRAG